MAKIIQYFAKIKEFIKDSYHKNKRQFLWLVVLFGVLFCMLIWWVTGSGIDSKKKKQNSLSVTVESYADGVEMKLETMLLSMKKVSNVKVFVMVDSSPIKNFLTETEVVKLGGENGSTTTTTKVVYNKNGSSNSPVEISTTLPKISGVLIFLNKIDASTKISIINAVATVLNIEPSCISILQDS